MVLEIMPGPERHIAEWHFLQLLCSLDLPPSLRIELCAKLSPELFRDSTCRIVFEEIRRMGDSPANAQVLREHLPSRVTARGFPDVDFVNLLADSSGEQTLTQIHKAFEVVAAAF